MAIVFKEGEKKPTEPILTKKLYELIKWAFTAGYICGNKCSDKRDGFEDGFIQLLNVYFEATDDNGQK